MIKKYTIKALSQFGMYYCGVYATKSDAKRAIKKLLPGVQYIIEEFLCK